MVRGQHTGIPGFFRACCREARRGGSFAYDHPAYELCLCLGCNRMPLDVEAADRQQGLDRLDQLVEAGDDNAVWQWFCDHYPKCMRLVPVRRREAFVAGVYQVAENGGLALECG